MKTIVLALLLALHQCEMLHAVSNETKPKRRRTMIQEKKKNLRRSVVPCVALEIFAEYQDKRHVDEPLACELQGEDLNGRKYRLIKIKGLASNWAQRNNVTSGATTIFVPDGAFIDDQTNELVIPSGATITLGRHKKKRKIGGRASIQGNMMDPIDLYWNRRQLISTGKRTVMVIRIQAKDAATTASEAQLADDIFGASGDVFNLKTGYDRCSYGQLQFEPLTNNSVVQSGGVHTVNLPATTVKNNAREVVFDAAIAQATINLGKEPRLLANHVMVCIPPGTGDWLAYSAVNHWMSVYNDKWCQYVSAQMHEIGHNLKLHHSGKGTDEYDDTSGMMGFSYETDDGPVMCFNGAKTWQLGWHSDFHVDLPFGSDFNWDGNLVGFAERSASSVSDRMIIRIRSISTDYYVHFNRKIGMNAGTQEGGDQVLVSSRVPGNELAVSYLLAKLSSGGVHTIPRFNGSALSLTIVVTAMNLNTAPARATISIRFGTRAPTSSPTILTPTQPPTLHPTTMKPTRRPTRPPTTRKPTSTPTLQPTSAHPSFAPSEPSESPVPSSDPAASAASVPTSGTPAPSPPSGAPSSTPSRAPSRTPSRAPSRTPSRTPSRAPSRAPSRTPSRAPSRTPTRSPVTKAPTLKPTPAPITRAPTRKPTRAPTRKPTRAPTRKPTRAPTRVPTWKKKK